MKKLRIIEPTRQQILQEMKPKIRVCAYCRVSTDSTKQHTSFVAQVTHYKDYIENHDGWEYAGIFADESSGTKSETREEFKRMIQACEQGEIDLVITKSLTRFARNTVTSMERLES